MSKISTLAPAQGATHNANNAHIIHQHFNPRSRTGSDMDIFYRGWLNSISTLAPAQGATSRQHSIPLLKTDFNPRSRTGSDRHRSHTLRQRCYFNPRSRTGSDGMWQTLRSILTIFQPSLPHRERPGQGGAERLQSRHFNPRSRTGSDAANGVYRGGGKISTHAPAQGATAAEVNRGLTYPNFNPRSRTGSDWISMDYVAVGGLFQPTLPHRERRRILYATNNGKNISTHAPAQGATQKPGSKRHECEFQPTLPHRERH